MTEKYRYCYVLDNGKPTFYDLNKKDILQMYQVEDLLNKQDAEIKRLKKANRGLQFKIIDMLDFVKEKGTVTREEIKKWWNGDVEL